MAASTFKEDPEWIARQLSPAISIDEAKLALKELESLGLIKRNPDGTLVQSHATIDTEYEVASLSLAQFHREMIRKGAESIERFSHLEREISSVTIGVSIKNAQRIKKLIQRFRKELLDICAEVQTVEKIYQANYQLFPLTEDLRDLGPK